MLWNIIFRVMIITIGIAALGFDAVLYNLYEKQKVQLNSVKDKLDVESEFNSNKFKYQQDQIERLSKDLDDAAQQIKGQNDALSTQKNALTDQQGALADQKDALLHVQTSLVDIKAEADAIKQDMKAWQNDYAAVLAQLEKKIENLIQPQPAAVVKEALPAQ